jgi:hypothetical protein
MAPARPGSEPRSPDLLALPLDPPPPLRDALARLGLPRPPGLPHFLVLGTQKGGTTTLQELLAGHPAVFLPACKEVHYFSLHADRGVDWYRARFAAARLGQRRGEITPYYLFHPHAPARIRALLPRARLVALLRDPVERALSQYFHAWRHGFETLPLEQALAAEPARLAGAEEALRAPGGQHLSHQKHSYLSRGRYTEQLRRYEALFPAEQLLVLRSEDLFADPEPTWRRIQAFLGLPGVPLPARGVRANAGGGEAAAVPEAVRRRLRAELAPVVAAVRARHGFDWGW